MTELPEPFQLLAQAGGVHLGPFGVAASEPPELVAYHEARRIAGDHAEAIEWMLSHATPAGRFYAALLSQDLGKDVSARAWETLASETAIVRFAPGGCTVLSAPLGHFAKSMQQTGDPLSALPQTPPSLPAPRPSAEPTAAFWTLEWLQTHPGTLALIFWIVAAGAWIVWLVSRR